jgi:hypothetical protein
MVARALCSDSKGRERSGVLCACARACGSTRSAAARALQGTYRFGQQVPDAGGAAGMPQGGFNFGTPMG